MPLKIKCPNPRCGRSLTIRDEYIGKSGRCPACNSVFKVNASRAAETPGLVAAEDPNAAVAASEAMPRPPVRPKQEVIDDLEVVEEDPPLSRTARAGSHNGPAESDYEVVDDSDRPRGAVSSRGKRTTRRREVDDDFDEAQDDLEYADGDRPRSAGSPGDWDKVSLGLTLNYYGAATLMGVVAVLLLCLIVAAFFVWIMFPSPSDSFESLRSAAKTLQSVDKVLGWIMKVTWWLGGPAFLILHFFGLALACWAPTRNHGKLLGITALGLASVVLLLGIISVPTSLGTAGTVMRIAAEVFLIGYGFVFLFYMRGLTQALKARDHSAAVLHLTIGWGAFWTVYLIVLTIGTTVLHGGRALAEGPFAGLDPFLAAVISNSYVMRVLGVVVSIVALVMVAWFTNTLVGLIKQIERRKLGGESERGELPLWVPCFGADAILYVISLILILILANKAGTISGFGAPPAAPQAPMNNPNPFGPQTPFPQQNPFGPPMNNQNPFGPPNNQPPFGGFGPRGQFGR